MKYISWQVERLDELVTLWHKELAERFPMRKELFLQNSFLDRNVCYESSRIVVNEDDHVIAFIVVKYLKELSEVEMRHDIGWIQTILVDSNYRSQGIGTELLQHAEAILQQKGITQILLGRDMYHYFPGIPSEDNLTATWFEKRGYRFGGTEVDLSKTFEEGEAIIWPKKSGLEFTLLKEDDQEVFLDFLHRCFPGRWELEAIQYFEKGGTGREFVVVKEGEDIIGFCRINDTQSPLIMGNTYWDPLFDSELGGVGPLGIDAEKRKNGYGLAVVQAGIAYLRERGIRHIVIDWTGLIEFYQKLGFEVWKSYKTYQKEL